MQRTPHNVYSWNITDHHAVLSFSSPSVFTPHAKTVLHVYFSGLQGDHHLHRWPGHRRSEHRKERGQAGDPRLQYLPGTPGQCQGHSVQQPLILILISYLDVKHKYFCTILRIIACGFENINYMNLQQKFVACNFVFSYNLKVIKRWEVF